MTEELLPQMQADCDGLREIFGGLDRLELQMIQAGSTSGSQRRGYFTPDEDDRVRQMLLAYRNYRIGLHEIIGRYRDYEELESPSPQLQAFLIGFAAALTLYAKSLKLIQTAEHIPLLRRKLNEPDAKFDLAEGFFDEVLQSYSSLGNYRHLSQANQFWRRQRRSIQKWLPPGNTEWHWLADVVRHQRVVVRKRLVSVLNARFRYDWRALVETTVKPLRQLRYTVQSFVGGTFAGARSTLHYRPALTEAVFSVLRGKLQPGDVLLVRAEEKLTSALLPGFWAHAAIFIGGQDDLVPLEICGHPHVQKHWNNLPKNGGPFGQVIEAISPRALINPLEKSLFADHVVVLRPNLSDSSRAAAITEAFGHLGKPYDFEFDFNVTSRVVCTELVYRSFHRQSGIEFSLVKRLGRFTLSGDDIMNMALESVRKNGPDRASFQVVALALKDSDPCAGFVPDAEMIPTLQRIQSGWRPARVEKVIHA